MGGNVWRPMHLTAEQMEERRLVAATLLRQGQLSQAGIARHVGGQSRQCLPLGRTLAQEGVITVVAIVDADTGELVEPPDFLARGFVHDEATFTDEQEEALKRLHSTS